MLTVFIILVCLACSFIFIGAFYCSTNTAVGVFFIVLGLLPLTGYAIYIMVKKQQAKLKEEEFKLWLTNRNFKIRERVGDFLCDSETSRWCIYMRKNIYEFSDIVKAYICKNSSRTWTSTRNSEGKSRSSSSWIKGTNWGTGTRSGSRGSSSNTTRTSRDTSTYGVEIQTKDIANPIVSIYCGQSASTARKILAMIKIMKNGGNATNDEIQDTEINEQ